MAVDKYVYDIHFPILVTDNNQIDFACFIAEKPGTLCGLLWDLTLCDARFDPFIIHTNCEVVRWVLYTLSEGTNYRDINIGVGQQVTDQLWNNFATGTLCVDMADSFTNDCYGPYTLELGGGGGGGIIAGGEGEIIIEDIEGAFLSPGAVGLQFPRQAGHPVDHHRGRVKTARKMQPGDSLILGTRWLLQSPDTSTSGATLTGNIQFFFKQ